MADDPTPDPKPDDDPEQDATPDPEPTPDPDDPRWDYERGMKTIQKLRDDLKQAKADAKKAAGLEARLKELEDATKTEEQKRADRLAELEGQTAALKLERQTDRLRLAVYEHAHDVGVTDPYLAVAALDRSKVEWDDGGQPTNIPDLLAETVAKHPALKAADGAKPPPARIDAGAGSGGEKPPNLTADELEAAAALGMTPERYAAVKGKTAVQEIVASGKKPAEDQ